MSSPVILRRTPRRTTRVLGNVDINTPRTRRSRTSPSSETPGRKRPRIGDITRDRINDHVKEERGGSVSNGGNNNLPRLESPSLEKLLSQDDSFFDQFVDQIEDDTKSEKDMFDESDDDNNDVINAPSLSTFDPSNIKSQNESPGQPFDETVVLDHTVTTSDTVLLPPSPHMASSMCSPHMASSMCSPPLSLPLSVLDLRAQALADLSNPKMINSPVQKPVMTPTRIVQDNVDVGPFYGLPSVVADLYKVHKKVDTLFKWQERCLQSEAVRNKSNLLYSLPTSGGKTLVAEIMMLQELVCYKRNVIFVLPYVSLVQEKIRSLTPFALELGFCLEEYAGAKGRFPPVKRRSKKDLFVCTIEKAHTLYNVLVSEGRTEELGLVVVDEVHMLGEGGRGAILETFLTKLKYVNDKQPDNNVQIVAMSATVGNLSELAKFLRAELFTDNYRPVELKEYLKVGRDVLEVKTKEGNQFQFQRKMSEVEREIKSIDQDGVTQLVLEVFPSHSVIVFCDTKKRCENVAELLAKVIQSNPEVGAVIFEHRRKEKEALLAALYSDGYLCPVLRRTVLAGVVYHHSGLTMDERKLLEEGFLSGVLGVMCCTSTLAAGVNLPARRVIIRSPFMGRNQLSHAQYKQMVGRAGRAGLDTHGESILLLQSNQVQLARDVMTAPIEHCLSCLHKSEGRGLAALILNCLHLGLVKSPADVANLIGTSLMSQQAKILSVDPVKLVNEGLQLLLTKGLVSPASETSQTQQLITATSQLFPTNLGKACVAGNIDLSWADKLYQDLCSARPGLAVDTSLHLLYLLTPYDVAERIYYSVDVYHSIFMGLAGPELHVASGLGVTEGVMVNLMRGKSMKKLKPVLSRLYSALILLDLWNTNQIHSVAAKFKVSRGEVQGLMSSAASFASSVFHFCQEIEEFWAFQELLEPYSRRLAHCASPELLPLLELPGVKASRARQLYSAGFAQISDVAKAQPKDLVAKVEHLSFKAAAGIIQGAKLMMTEKVENLKDQAETVMMDMALIPPTPELK